MWFLVGILVGLLLFFAYMKMQRATFTVRWYEWLIAALGVALVLWGFQNIIAATGDSGSSSAPWTFFLVIALPGILLLLIAAGFPVWRYMAARKSRRGG